MVNSKSLQRLQSPAQSGFALLMTLIVVGVIVSIGLSVLDLSTKQIRLSTNAKDSEVAFHAANAGMECARYWRNTASTSMERGSAFSPNCFGVGSSPASVTGTKIITGVLGDGEVFKYDYSFSWGVSDSHCTKIVTLVASSTTLVSSSTFGSGFTTSQVATHVPGYPTDSGGNSDWFCAAGSRCSVISVRGYNKSCADVLNRGTIEREVLLQF